MKKVSQGLSDMEHSYKGISAEILDPDYAEAALGKEAVLSHMLVELAAAPWADIGILDWRPGDDELPVEYCFAGTLFGSVLVANTPKGVCYLGLAESTQEHVFKDFNSRFGYARRIEKQTPLQKQALDFLDGKTGGHITLHLRGTLYQTGIWKRLIRIPFGKVVSYATLGEGIRYSRAAGTANGRNPIFWIVPCHRAVKTGGGFDRYFWGENVKKRLLAWEFAASGK